MIRNLLLTTALAMAICAPARAQETATAGLSTEQAAVLDATPGHADTLQLAAWFDRAGASYAIGEQVRLFVQTNEDAYVTILDIGPTGHVAVLFPNALNPAGLVHGGRPEDIPGAGLRITASGPAGSELIKIVATRHPVAVIPENHLSSAGLFRVMPGGTPDLLADLRALEGGAFAGEPLVVANRTLRTLAPQPGNALFVFNPPQLAVQPAPVVAVAPQASVEPARPLAPVEPVAFPAPVAEPISIDSSRNPFALFASTDHARYASGDSIGLVVTSMQQCHLTVFDIDPAGRARIVFPNNAHPDNRIEARQPVFVAGENGLEISAAGDAGAGQFIAACALDAPGLANVSPDLSQRFTAFGDRDSLARVLMNARANAAGVVAVATATFSVQSK